MAAARSVTNRNNPMMDFIRRLDNLYSKKISGLLLVDYYKQYGGIHA